MTQNEFKIPQTILEEITPGSQEAVIETVTKYVNSVVFHKIPAEDQFSDLEEQIMEADEYYKNYIDKLLKQTNQYIMDNI